MSEDELFARANGMTVEEYRKWLEESREAAIASGLTVEPALAKHGIETITIQFHLVLMQAGSDNTTAPWVVAFQSNDEGKAILRMDELESECCGEFEVLMVTVETVSYQHTSGGSNATS